MKSKKQVNNSSDNNLMEREKVDKYGRHKVRYSRAEKSLLKNLTIVKIVTVIGIILNLILPIMSSHLGLQCFTQWIIVVCYIIALINATGWQGWTTQYIPLLPIGLIRIFQVLFHLFISSTPINYTFFVIVVIYDSVYILLLLLMKSSYEFVKE